MDLSYDGAGFFGWQRQPDAPSVQGAIEDALATLLHAPTPVTGAGRTDTGVNASFYTAHFDAAEIDCAQTAYKLNAILPKQISIIGIKPVADDFHARFGAKRREYTYYLHRCKDPFLDSHSYQFGYPALDVEAMNRAAALLLGTHDFSSFEKTGSDNATSICTVTEAGWHSYVPSLHSGPDDSYLYFRISADRFLRNMVRAIVGTLLEVGRGKRSVESVGDILERKDRCCAGQSAPGYALFLSDIEF